MEDQLARVFSVSVDELERGVSHLGGLFGVHVPEEARQAFEKIRRIQSFGDVESFLKGAPKELLEASAISELARLVEGWQRLVGCSDDLVRVAAFVKEAIFPPADVRISFAVKSIKALVPTVIFRNPHRVDELLDMFDKVFATYYRAYLRFHTELNERLRRLQEPVREAARRIVIMEKLASIPSLEPYCACDALEEAKTGILEATPCPHTPTEEEVAKYLKCPVCQRTFLDEGLLSIIERVLERCDKAFRYCVDALAFQLSQAVLEREDDPLRSVVDSINVSDLSGITNVLSDELLERISRLLGEKR